MTLPLSEISGPVVPPEWEWYYHKLLEFRESLLNDVNLQEDELVQPIERHSMNMADSGTDEFDHDMALAILSNENDALYEVDSAIKRIQNGTYGVCEATGAAIPLERLKAVPWTRYTKEALEQMERQGAVDLPRLGEVVSLQGEPPGGLAESREPEKEELIGLEAARLQQENTIRELAGEEGLDITSIPANEP